MIDMVHEAYYFQNMITKTSLLFALLCMVCVITPFDALAKKGAFEAAPPPPEGSSLVYIYRIKVPPGLRTPKILVDGTAALQLPNNSYSWFYVTAGTHAIKTKWGFMAEVPDLEFVATILPNQTHYLKLEGSERSWGIGRTKIYTGIKEVTESEAQQDLQKKLTYSPAETPDVATGTVAQKSTDSKNLTESFTEAAPPLAGYSLVYIYRPDAPPALRRATILVGGKAALKLPNKAYSWFYLREGDHKVRTSWGTIYRGVKIVEIPLNVHAGATYYLRLSGTKTVGIAYDGHASRLDPVDAELAAKELAKIKSYEPADIQNVD